MKTTKVAGIAVGLLCMTVAQAQTMPGTMTSVSKSTVMGAVHDSSRVSTVGSQPAAGAMLDSTDVQLDRSVTALESGNKAASTQALQAGITGLEASAGKTSFKDKILAQVSKLKALLPLITGGSMGVSGLRSAVGLAKMAANAGKLEGLLSAGSLIGKSGMLASGLSGISSGLGSLGSGAQSTGQSLLTTALSSVGKLDQGSMLAKAAEPAVKSQIGSVLNFVKGAL